jgi:transcription-repair coupling factor (superfamily II helicase)
MIGFSLYTDLLERAVSALKDGRTPDLDKPLHTGPEIDLSVPALIPDDYVFDVHTRLVLYKRIAGMETDEQLRDLQIELIDRFGLLPEAVKNLFAIASLKLLASPMGIRKIELGNEEGRIQFDQDPAIDTDMLIELIQSQPQHYRLEGATRLRLSGNFHEEASRFQQVLEILKKLSLNG